jgi:hypothetical protein
MLGRTRQALWRGPDGENGIETGRGRRGDLGRTKVHSDDQYLSRWGLIGRATAQTSSNEGRGILLTNIGARREAKLTSHRVGHSEAARLNSSEAKLAKTRRK